MGLNVDISIPFFTAFVQGILSFLSPCVLPLVPIYIGYLSGGAAIRDADGKLRYDRGRVFLNTVFFILGISFAFFVLGLGFSAAALFFRSNRTLFVQVGAVIVILFGLYQLGLFGKNILLEQERRLPLHLERLIPAQNTDGQETSGARRHPGSDRFLSLLFALLLGFFFSFAWTPCVGPTLSSILIMAASANAGTIGFALLGVYTLGFVLPFLAVGLFTTTLLDFFRAHRNLMHYTVKAGGVLMIVTGILMFTGRLSALTGILATYQ